jgi:hypothetical protein
MHLGAMNGLPSKATSGVRTRAVILLRRCLSSALSALNTFFTTYLGLEYSSGSRRTKSFQRFAPLVAHRPSPFHLSPPLPWHATCYSHRT